MQLGGNPWQETRCEWLAHCFAPSDASKAALEIPNILPPPTANAFGAPLSVGFDYCV